MPESLPPENRRPFSWKRANPVGSLLALRRFRGVVDLAWMYFIFNFAKAAAGTIRKELGESIQFNCTHGSDAQDTAAYEIGYFFSGAELV